MFMIMAYGSNDIAFPIYFSEDENKLKTLLKKTFPDARFKSNDKVVYLDDYAEDDEYEGWEKILKNYYEGCGGICILKIKKVPVNKPFIDWDLD